MRELFAQLLARVRSASRQQRLYLLLGVVVALLGLRYGGSWLGDFSAGLQSDIQLGSRRLANAKVLLQQADAVGEALAVAQARHRKAVAQLVPGDTSTLAAAALQDHVSDLARENLVRIQSTQVLKEEPRGVFTAVVLRVTAQAGIGNLAKFLGTLEAGMPRISVGSAEVSRRNRSNRRRAGKKAKATKEARVMSATFQISAIVQVSAVAAEAEPSVSLGTAVVGANS